MTDQERELLAIFRQIPKQGQDWLLLSARLALATYQDNTILYPSWKGGDDD